MEKSELNRQYYYLMIWSSFANVLAALFLQFLYSLQTGTILLLFGVKFQYRPFGIKYLSVLKGQWGNWSEAKIMVVYGIGVVIFFILGRIVLKVNNMLKLKDIVIRLFLVWFSFIAMHMLPMGMLAGVFFFDDFGIAFTWLFPEKWLRLTIALVFLAFCIYMRPFWLKQFIKLSFTQDAVRDLPARREYIIRVMIMPYFFGTLILVPFMFSGLYWYWMLTTAIMFLIVLPIFNPFFPRQRNVLIKTEVPAITSTRQRNRLILILAGLLALAFFRINFV